MIEILGHKLETYGNMRDYFKCITCKLIIMKYQDGNGYFISGFNEWYGMDNNKLISCNEIIIKKLLE